MNHEPDRFSSTKPCCFGTRNPWRLVAVMLALLAGFFLLREHWGHVFGLWPYALLLICPLMHLFHGHGPHQHRHGTGLADPEKRD